MQEIRKKYLAELSEITSPYFSKSPNSYKMLQHTPSKFTNSGLSDIFPDFQSKSQIKLEKPARIQPRPVTSVSCKKIPFLQVSKKPIQLGSSDHYIEFAKYIDSLIYLKSLTSELHINYLLTNSARQTSAENLIPFIPLENLSKEALIEKTLQLTAVVRNHIEPSSGSIEML